MSFLLLRPLFSLFSLPGKQLHAQNNGLGPEGAKYFGSMLEHNSTLTLLDVSGNQMKAEGAAALADGLKANQSVQQLDPFGNKIPEDVLRTIMNSNKNISNFGGAVKLDYSGIGMDSTDVKVLAELLKANSTVQWLHAQNNGLGPEGAKSFGSMLEHNNTLTLLDVSGNQMKAEGAAALAGGLKANTGLQQLDASSNAMGSAGAKAFGDTLLVNKTLQTLDVSDNNFGKITENFDQVKLKSSGEMSTVTKAYRGGGFKVRLSSGQESEWLQPSDFEWESHVSAFCAGVAASPSLISVSTIFKHALAVLFLTPPLFPTMYVARCFQERHGHGLRKALRRHAPGEQDDSNPGRVR